MYVWRILSNERGLSSIWIWERTLTVAHEGFFHRSSYVHEERARQSWNPREPARRKLLFRPGAPRVHRDFILRIRVQSSVRFMLTRILHVSLRVAKNFWERRQIMRRLKFSFIYSFILIYIHICVYWKIDCKKIYICIYFLASRAEKNSIGNQSWPKSRQESQSARKESRIESDPILFLTILPRLCPRLSSRLLVTNVTILSYCMVITSPRTGSLSDNITVASWKLGTSFEVFLSKTFFLNEIWPKAFIVHILKCIKKFFVNVFFQNGGYDDFFSRIRVFQIGWQHKWNIFHPIDHNHE